MINFDIVVPKEYQYLSNWSDFDSIMPSGHVILNKSICGCGCTDYYLTNSLPVILVSPRKALITSKLKGGRTAGKLFYFDRSNGGDVSETITAMGDYLSFCGGNPFGGQLLVPKIMVTYDSLPYVVDALKNWNLMDRFTIVVDEFTCIFTDVKFKGSVEVNLLHQLETLPNRIVYISATPLKDEYLSVLGQFQNLPYVTLQWDPSRVETVNVYYSKMTSPVSAIGQIIKDYRRSGVFKSKIVNGQRVDSTEAVFFLNSVEDIIKIIRKYKLTPAETMVICADTASNWARLKRIQFSIGTVPNETEYTTLNKPFMFVTKCSFEGTDFYSDSSTSYVFADCHWDNLALDISIDLPQIAGRCRSKNNPFRKEIFYYYKHKNNDLEGQMNLNELLQHYADKRADSIQQVKELANVTHPGHRDRILQSQERYQYSKNYVDAVDNPDGTWTAVCNELAYVADVRAAEIKANQYQSTYQMLSFMKENGFVPKDQNAQQEKLFTQFMALFDQDGNFERRMKLMIDTINYYPCLEDLIDQAPVIPYECKEYYHELGPDRIKACAYIEANLKRELDNVRRASMINLQLEPDVVYSNAAVKKMIQDEYDRLGMNAKAKATEITKYVPDVIPARYTDENGKKQNGYKLI